MHLGTMESSRFLCEGLPTGEVIVGDIREDIPESMVCSYFGKKSSKSGWDYRGHTSVAEQRAIKDLYFRVYDQHEPPNKEITLAFARGLISMSLGNQVNWAQFSAERRKVREALRRKAEARKEKRLRESENADEEAPTVIGKRRLSAPGGPQSSFPETLCLTPKSEEALEEAAMAKKSQSRAGRHGVAPRWGPEEVESLARVMSSTRVLLQEATVSLEQGGEELVSVEDRLRRSLLLRSDRQAMLSESKAHLRSLGEQERALRSTLELKAALLRELELRGDPCGREEVRSVAAEVLRVNADIESVVFKRGLEDSAIRMYVTAIAGCEDTVAEMEAKKFTMSASQSSVESRVSGLKLIMSAMEEQMCRMRNGEGAAFFPLPVEGCPQSPVAVTHILNACPICSLWYTCYNYSTLSCGHTYHPYCLYEHAQRAKTCAVAVCGLPFEDQSLRAIGIRPTSATVVLKPKVEKPRSQSSNDLEVSVTGSGCEPASSWEKEALVHASQESSQKQKVAKTLPRNNSREDLPADEATASEDMPSLGCILCRMKKAAVYVKPCGHDVLCFGCTQGCQYCPVCRVKVEGWGKIKKKSTVNPFLPVGRISEIAPSEIPTRSASLGCEGSKSVLADASKVQDTEPEEEAQYSSSDGEDNTRTWCSDDVFFQGGARSHQDVDVAVTVEPSADVGEEHIADVGEETQGEDQTEDEEEVPRHFEGPSINKSLKRFAAVSDLVASEPTSSATKRRQVPPVAGAPKKAILDCEEFPKKRAVGRPAGKVCSKLKTGTRSSTSLKDMSTARSHALRHAGKKRDLKEIIPAKFR